MMKFDVVWCIVHNWNLEFVFGNRRPTGEAKTRVLGTFYFWNHHPTTLCANGLTLRMMQKTSKNSAPVIFFNLLIFRRFSTLRMWFLHVSPISSMLLIPRHLFESFRSSDSDLMNKGWFNELVGGHFTCTFLSVQHVTVQQARSAYITEDISHRDFMMWGKNGMSGMWLSDAQWAVGGWTFLAIVYDETCQALLWKFCAPCFQWKKYLETRVNL